MPFTSITSSDLLNVLAGRDALAVPELSTHDFTKNNLFAALSTSARTQIEAFVENGGNLLVFYSGATNERALVNGLFGFSVASAGTASTYSLNGAEAAGTPFAGGPSSLNNPSAVSPVNLTTLPPGSRTIYRSGSSVAVASIPVGCGTVTLMGWDWFNAVPVGSLDGGWLSVLNRALGEGKRAYVANDFNGDTHADILYRKTSTGKIAIWLMDGNTRKVGAPVGDLDPATWKMAGTGDFNRDGRADVLWHNQSNGSANVWLMDGFSKTNGAVGQPPISFAVQSVKGYDGDGASDILWRNMSSGALVIWFMSGFNKTVESVSTVPLVWGVEE